MASQIFREFLRYAVAGTAATAIDFSVLCLLVEYLQINYLIAASLAFIVASGVAYLLNVSFVFRGYYQRRFNTLPIIGFLLISLIGLLVNSFGLWLGVSCLDLHYQLAKLISIAMVTTFNFSAKKWLIFNRAMAEKLAPK